MCTSSLRTVAVAKNISALLIRDCVNTVCRDVARRVPTVVRWHY
jgi:hypothetical protein